MSLKIGFQHIFHDAQCIEDNEFYQVYVNSSAPFMYDYNYLQLHYQPTLEEFQVIEKNLQHFVKELEWEHKKIVWPEGVGLSPEVINYLEKNQYGLEMLELYSVQPSQFSPSYINEAVTVCFVTEETLPIFKKLSYEQDLEIGQEFAEYKQSLYDQQFIKGKPAFILAYLNEEPVGGVSIIETSDTVEIDALFVRPQHQRKGIGAAIQQFVMGVAGVRPVILVADADDTPREMYTKQGYTYQNFQIGAVKTQ